MLHYTTLYYTNCTTPQLQPQLHYTTTTTPLHYNYSYNCNYNCATPHYYHCNHCSQKTQLQPPFGPSVDSLCHSWFTTTHLSYSFLSLKLPPPPYAVLLVLYGSSPSWRGCVLRNPCLVLGSLSNKPFVVGKCDVRRRDSVACTKKTYEATWEHMAWTCPSIVFSLHKRLGDGPCPALIIRDDLYSAIPWQGHVYNGYESIELVAAWDVNR